MKRETTEDQQRLQQAIEKCLQAIDQGQPINRDEFLARYPEFSEELREFLDSQEHMQRLVPSTPMRLGQSEQPADVNDRATLDIGGPNRRQAFGPVSTFANYELLGEIARGGMGVVYKAKQINLDRVVALKMILDGQLATTVHVQRFYQEAEAAANLKHPGIVPIFEVGQHEGQHFFSMAYVDGPSLSGFLDEGPIPPREAAELAQRIALAVAYAHSQGVIHRDLKPSNVLLARRPDRDSDDKSQVVYLSGPSEKPERAGHYEPMVTDFGLAKRIEAKQDLTVSGQILGTPSYMPPEQASGKPKVVGPRADIYALGAILYDLLTGRPPFEAATAMDTLIQVLHNEPVSPRQINPQTPRDLETICLKCLEKDPDKRYATADALAEDLGRYLNEKPILARPVGPLERTVKWVRRNPVVSVLIAAVFLTMILGSAFSTWFAFESRANATLAESKTHEAEVKANEASQAAKLAKENATAAKTNETRALASEAQARASEAQAKASEARAKASEAQAKKDRQTAVAALVEKEREHRRAEQLVYDNLILLSRREWENGDLYRAQEVLAKTPWHLRNWEFHYLSRLYHDEPALIGHEAAIHALAFSPDTQWVASGDAFGIVRVWELSSRHVHFTIDTERHSVVEALAFSPDSKVLAASGDQIPVELWDAQLRRRLLVFEGHDHSTHVLAFSPDGAKLAGAYADGTIVLWDAKTGQSLQKFSAAAHAVCTLTFDSESKQLASLDYQGGLALWDVETGERKKLKIESAFARGAIHFDDNGDLFCWRGSASPMLSNATTGKSTHRYSHHDFEANQLVWHPKRKRFAITDTQGKLHLWLGAPTRFPSRTLTAPVADGSRILFDANANWLASLGKNHTVRLWNVENTAVSRLVRSQFGSPRFHPRSNKGVEFSKSKKEMIVWSLASGKNVGQLTGHEAPITHRTWSPDGQRLASGSKDRTVRVWDLETLQAIAVLKGHEADIRVVQFCSDPKYVASVDAKKQVVVWSVDTGEKLMTVEARTTLLVGDASSPRFWFVTSNAATPNRGRLVSYNCVTGKTSEVGLTPPNTNSHRLSPGGDWFVQKRQNQVYLFATNRQEKHSFGVGARVGPLTFSPDGKYLAGIAGSRQIFLIDIPTKRLITEFERSDGKLEHLAFSPDGKRLVSSEETGVVRLWELTAFQPVLVFRDRVGPLAFTHAVGFASGGTMLFCVSDLGIALWDAGTPFHIKRVQGLAEETTATALRPDGKAFAAVSHNGHVQVWDAITGKPTLSYRKGTGWGESLAYSPDSSLFAIACHAKVKIVNAQTGELVHTLPDNKHGIFAVTFSPNGSRLFVGDGRGFVTAWNVRSWKKIFAARGGTGVVRKVVVSADGQRLAVSYSLTESFLGIYNDVAVVVWDLPSKEVVTIIRGKKKPIRDLTLTQDGTRLAVAQGGDIRLWDVEAKADLKRTPAHDGKVVGVAFSPDDQRLLTCGKDGTVRIWNVEPWEQTFVFRGTERDVSGVKFGPQGRWVLSHNVDETCYYFEPVGTEQSVHARKNRRFPVRIRNP